MQRHKKKNCTNCTKAKRQKQLQLKAKENDTKRKDYHNKSFKRTRQPAVFSARSQARRLI